VKKESKPGRNQPCPCGSGKKFKSCHEAPHSTASSSPDIQAAIDELHARQKRQQQQQGLGRPIFSTMVGDERLVAVGDRIYRSRKWKTFHDFLLSYIRDVMGGSWGDEELQKPREARHPLLNWYQQATIQINAAIKRAGKVHTTAATGAMSAYLQLAYNPYLIAHNVTLQEKLIRRLKIAEQFLPAVYETRVAAALIQAGFDVTFEDESDSRVSHCEFTASFSGTGKNFSVEAKLRLPNKDSVDVGNQLYAALAKRADHPRIVFIELNVPDDFAKDGRPAQLTAVLKSLRTREDKLKIRGDSAPPAYVVITNNPDCYSPEAPVRRWAFVEGFKMPDFRMEAQYSSLREARDRHIEISDLIESLRQHVWVPMTFDADIPELVFGKTHARLQIGNNYRIRGADGTENVGKLLFAHVLKESKKAFGICVDECGKNNFVEFPLTDDELAGYERHPDTFFGRFDPSVRPINEPLKMYDWFQERYGRLEKPKLLNLMKDAPDVNELQQLSQRELAETYCERLVYAILRDAQKPAA
jgi:hypothetical protein